MVQNTRKVTQPVFFRQKSCWPKFVQQVSKMGQKWPKNGLFQHFLKNESLWTLWLGCMVHHPYIWENLGLAKFWAKRPESSRPIRLLHFQNGITSKPLDGF